MKGQLTRCENTSKCFNFDCVHRVEHYSTEECEKYCPTYGKCECVAVIRDWDS